jgi:hypothetical protein
MRRRALLTAAGTALLAGCARTAPAAGGTSTASYPSASGTPAGPAVASWRLIGGFLAPGYVAIRPPRVSIYPDGLAVADATYQLRLSRAEMDALVAALVRRLADDTAGRRLGGAPMVADAPATQIVVRSAGHTYTVTADAVDELRSRKAYPSQLYEARDLLAAVYQRVVAGGQRYRASRVRLVATPVRPGAGSQAPVAPWPAGVPVPGPTGAGDVLASDLDGAAAGRALAAFPLQPDARTWTTYAAPGGRRLQAAVRYLLPDE